MGLTQTTLPLILSARGVFIPSTLRHHFQVNNIRFLSLADVNIHREQSIRL